MNNFDKIDYVYFLGIGGIGMSALARYFNSLGKKVYGYDKEQSNLCIALENEGMNIIYQNDSLLIPLEILSHKEKVMIVFTPAIPKDNKLFSYFATNRFFMLKRARVLGMIADNYTTIAISGTHGKTTISSLMNNILMQAGKDNFGFLGGISKNIDSNLLLPKNQERFLDKNTLLVAEADEFDRSFLWLHPFVSLITYMDADHLDIYKDRQDIIETFNKFANQICQDGYLVINHQIKDLVNVQRKKYTYSIEDKDADFFANDISLENGIYTISVKTPSGIIDNLTLGARGKLNVENSIACVAICFCLGLTEDEIRGGLESFSGVKRRLDFHYQDNDIVFIDDYAHHPKEISSTIDSIKELFPGKKITGVFQPHLFSRTRDFASEFAHSLDKLDNLVLKEIYPAREKPIEGVNSLMLKRMMKNKNVVIINDDSKILEHLQQQKPEVLVTLGAGNVDKLIAPIKNWLNENK